MAAMSFRTPSLSSTDCGDCNWSGDELAGLEVYVNGLPPWQPPAAPCKSVAAGTSAANREAISQRLHIVSAERIRQAIRDDNLDRGHLKVLANLWERFNKTTCTAWPSRERVAEEEGLDTKSVANNLYDLRRLGYIDWGRLPNPKRPRRTLLHYWWLEDEIAAGVKAIRENCALPEGQERCPPLRAQSNVPLAEGNRSALPEGTKSALPEGNKELIEEGTLRRKTPRVRAHSDPNGKGSGSGGTGAPSKAEIDDAFNEWWAHYPRKVARLAAKKAYLAIVTGKHRDREAHATAQQLLAAVQAFKFPRDEDFIKHPATWLNDGSWDDVGAGSCGAGSVSLPPNWWRNNPLAAAAIGLDAWRMHVRARPSGPWSEAMLGPPPGSRGCVVPSEIIHEFRLTELYTVEGRAR